MLHFSRHSDAGDTSQTSSPPSEDIAPSSQAAPVSLVAHSTSHPCAHNSTPLSYMPHTTVLLATSLVKLTAANGTSHVFRALLDSGSMSDFVSERAAQLLGSPRHCSNLTVMGLSQCPSQTRGMLALSLETLSGKTVSSPHQFQILDSISVHLPRAPISATVFHRMKGYTLADPTFHLPGGVDVLLGSTIFPKILTHENFSLGPNLPQVLGTLFGFVLMGAAPCDQPTSSTVNHTVTLHSTSDVELHHSLQRFFPPEDPPIGSSSFTAEPHHAAHVLQDHIPAGSDLAPDNAEPTLQPLYQLHCGEPELQTTSSHPQPLPGLPLSLLETPALQDPPQPQYSLLGLPRSASLDTLSSPTDLPPSACTLRQTLRSSAGIYDPYDFLAPMCPVLSGCSGIYNSCSFLTPMTMWSTTHSQILWTQPLYTPVVQSPVVHLSGSHELHGFSPHHVVSPLL